MTSQCKEVLSELKKLTNNTECNISYLGYTDCFCIDDADKTYNYEKYESEIESIITSLVEEGYLRYNYGNIYNFCLTQKGIHKGQFTLSAVTAYLLNNLISILALIVAIIALFT